MALHADLTREIDEGPAGPAVGAFFDLDGTLIAGFSAVAFLRDRLASGRMRARDLAVNSRCQCARDSRAFSLKMCHHLQ